MEVGSGAGSGGGRQSRKAGASTASVTVDAEGGPEPTTLPESGPPETRWSLWGDAEG